MRHAIAADPPYARTSVHPCHCSRREPAVRDTKWT